MLQLKQLNTFKKLQALQYLITVSLTQHLRVGVHHASTAIQVRGTALIKHSAQLQAQHPNTLNHKDRQARMPDLHLKDPYQQSDKLVIPTLWEVIPSQ